MKQNNLFQEKLSAEISQVLAKYGNKVTYESIQEMEYLDMCFKGKTNI